MSCSSTTFIRRFVQKWTSCWNKKAFFFYLLFECKAVLCSCVWDRMREVDLGCGRALLVKENGEFSAMGHKCPHYGAPLVKGKSNSHWDESNHAIKKIKLYLFKTSFSSWRCAFQRTCALSMARCLLQHFNRRHRGLPRSGQSPYLPGERPCWCFHRTHSKLCGVFKQLYQSCLFAPGQSWKGQGDHSCKQAGKKY